MLSGSLILKKLVCCLNISIKGQKPCLKGNHRHFLKTKFQFAFSQSRLANLNLI